MKGEGGGKRGEKMLRLPPERVAASPNIPPERGGGEKKKGGGHWGERGERKAACFFRFPPEDVEKGERTGKGKKKGE